MPIACPNCGAENPERARFCLNCATALEPDVAQEERKLATVIFADLVGSTALAGAQDPEQVRHTLNRFYDAMTEEVERWGGTVEKFAGDAVMAAFGAPAALEDHAERALHAALAMHQRLADLFGGRLALRIGVNTGDVVVGRPREGSSFVTGDAVNVAARLEQAAAAGETFAGERTVTAAAGAFEFGEPTTLEAKGKPGGVPARLVLRAISLMRPRGVRGLPSVFVGRGAEFAELQERYQGVAADATPHLVSILGDAGVGKSRLTRELWEWLSSQSPEPLRRTGRTLAYGTGTTYWPMGEVIKEHFGISEDEGAEAIAAKLADRPYLGLTLGIAAGEDLHPLVARERLHDAWVEFLSHLANDRPVVLLIEDVHWAEDQLCDLIDTLVAQVTGPLLVLVTARPELLDRRPAWGGSRGRTSAMRLEALPPADTSTLLGRLLGDEVPQQIRSLVVERAEGNPFFVEELIATLIDLGVLRRENGSWAFGRVPEGFTIPDSVQAVLSARIDLLADAEKAGLQAAAVIGRTFWSGPMYELVQGQGPNISVLEEREFVIRQPLSTLPGEREYLIKHALTREVAYGTLTRVRRAQLHAAFAGWLDRLMEGREELAPLLAHHYTMAVRPEDLDLAWAGQESEVTRLRASAVRWSRRAAELAVGRYEIDDGIALLRRAVEMEPDTAVQADLWYQIGHASALKYDGEAFVAAMERALELGASKGEVYAELAYQTSMRAGMWQRQLANDLVEGWIEWAVADSAEGTPARVRALVARANWHSDVDAARVALAIADTIGDAQLRFEGLGALQGVMWDGGEFLEACDVAVDRMELLPTIADPDQVADALLMNVGLFLTVGRTADARAMAQRMEETVVSLTPHHKVHGLEARLTVETAVADWEAARALTQRTEQAIEANLATPCPLNVGLLLRVALAWTIGGDEVESARLVAKAESIGMVGYGRINAPARLRLAIAHQDRDGIRAFIDSVKPEWLTPGDREMWAALFDGLVEIDDQDRIEAEAPQWMRSDAYVAPFAVRALGIARKDVTLLADAAARFEAMGLDRHAEATRTTLDRIGADIAAGL